MDKMTEKVKFIGGSLDGKVRKIPAGTRSYMTGIETYLISVVVVVSGPPVKIGEIVDTRPPR